MVDVVVIVLTIGGGVVGLFTNILFFLNLLEQNTRSASVARSHIRLCWTMLALCGIYLHYLYWHVALWTGEREGDRIEREFAIAESTPLGHHMIHLGSELVIATVTQLGII